MHMSAFFYRFIIDSVIFLLFSYHNPINFFTVTFCQSHKASFMIVRFFDVEFRSRGWGLFSAPPNIKGGI